jgi:hypothetical protein
MDERARRLVFLFLFAVAFFETGAHASQAFVNYPAWKHIGIDTFPAYHHAMAPRAGLWILLPRLLELVLATVVLRYRPTPLKRGPLVIAIALALLAVISTVVLQRPIHGQLESLGNTAELLACRRPIGSGCCRSGLGRAYTCEWRPSWCPSLRLAPTSEGYDSGISQVRVDDV